MRGLITGFLLLLIASATAFPATSSEVPVINLPGRGAVSLLMTPMGKVDLERLSTLSRIRIEIEKIAMPETLAPAMNTYVVWAISPEGVAENVGALAVADGRGRLETVTPLDRFGVLITAEPHYLVDMPSAFVAYTNQVPRDTLIRRTAVKVETGRYSYANLKVTGLTAGTPPIVTEARTAMQIAQAANAPQLAESEFRQARVTFDTMETLVSRSNPADIVIPAAHDTVRAAARATLAAREAAAGRNASFAFGDDLMDSTGALTAAGRDTVQRIAAAAGVLSGPFRIRCSAKAMPVARRALTQAGVSEDRLVFVTPQ
jgi:hypothetical protein